VRGEEVGEGCRQQYSSSINNKREEKNSEKVNREEEEKEGEWKGGNDGGSFFVFFLLNGVVLECMTRHDAMLCTIRKPLVAGWLAERMDGQTNVWMDGRTKGF